MTTRSSTGAQITGNVVGRADAHTQAKTGRRARFSRARKMHSAAPGFTTFAAAFPISNFSFKSGHPAFVI